MLLNELFLNEVAWQERSPIGDVLRRHAGKNRFIHFSNQRPKNDQRSPFIPKLGINPMAFHGDPLGVYAYPVDWLLTHDKATRGEQFTTNYPYWWIMEVNLNDINGIKLATLRQYDAQEIANNNGWGEELLTAVQNKDTRLVGDIFWSTAKSLAMKGRNAVRMPWSKSLAGISWIFDDGVGIIHGGEQSQIVILKMSAMHVIDSGSNVGEIAQRNGSQNRDYVDTRHLLMKVFTYFRGQYGGNFKENTKSNSIALHFTGGKANFILHFQLNPAWSSNFTLNYNYGRAIGSHIYKLPQKNESSLDEIKKNIETKIHEVSGLAKRGRDLLFTPMFSEGEVIAALKERVCGEGFVFSTEIENTTGAYHRAEMTITATRSITSTNENGVTKEYLVRVMIRKDNCTMLGIVRINNETVLTTNSFDIVDWMSEQGENRVLLDKLNKSLSNEMNQRLPDINNYRTFFNAEDCDIFAGDIVSQSHIKGWIELHPKEVKKFQDAQLSTLEVINRDLKTIYRKF